MESEKKADERLEMQEQSFHSKSFPFVYNSYVNLRDHPNKCPEPISLFLATMSVLANMLFLHLGKGVLIVV